jgi:hypothetical protein
MRGMTTERRNTMFWILGAAAGMIALRVLINLYMAA